MPVKTSMFLFEVTLQKVETFNCPSRDFVYKADFADIFSLELKDPKKEHIVIPEPPPLPPEPPGKKGKKKKPKPKKKKGKKGKEPPPPPEPAIMVGQSVLFTSSPEALTELMNNNTLEVSIWSKDDKSECIGTSRIAWDNKFQKYLENVMKCEDCTPPVVNDEYNVFEEGGPKILAKMTLEVKLSYLTDKLQASFRSLSENPGERKWLYTGMNSKTTSFICNLKTTDEEYKERYDKLKVKYTKDRVFPTPGVDKMPAVFADYTNAPGAKVPFLDERDITCCKGSADKPPTDNPSLLETVPDIDFICDYVRKIIRSCNDNMRMLTPRPTIRPRIRATDIDKLCYCKETAWPEGELARRFKNEVQSNPCPICIRKIDGKPREGTLENPIRTFDIANIRGPCGRHDCRIARDLRDYIQKLFDEDNKEIKLDDIVGPCGSKDCALVDRIHDFLRHRGAFKHTGEATVPGLTTRCACTDKMKKSFMRTGSCNSLCSFDCETNSSEFCGGTLCSYKKDPPEHRSKSAPSPRSSGMYLESNSDSESPSLPKIAKCSSSGKSQNVNFHVYYFTVEYDKEPTDNESTEPSPASSVKSRTASSNFSGRASRTSRRSSPVSAKTSHTSAKSSTVSGKTSHTSGKSSSVSEKTSHTSGKSSPVSEKTSHTSGKSRSTSGKSSPVSGKSSATSGKSSLTVSKNSSTVSEKRKPESVADALKEPDPFEFCDPQCPVREDDPVCGTDVCPGPSWPSEKKKKATATPCTNPVCPNTEKADPASTNISPADSNIVIDFDNIKNPCCVKSCAMANQVKDYIVAGWSKKQKPESCMTTDPCYCDCVCEFRVPGRTTYCGLCGGYEYLGDDVRELPVYARPHPCPVYHKLYDRNLLKTRSPWPEEKKVDESTAVSKSLKGSPRRLSPKSSDTQKGKPATKIINCDTIKKLGQKKLDRKKGKYSDIFAGLKQPAKHICDRIGYEKVPRYMGWNWKAEDIPGLKPRPKWRPGAANRILVRRYLSIRQGIDIMTKKKRALQVKKKKLEMKPTIVVTKKNGEFTVQMEVLKQYSKDRLLHQYPYDDQPPLIYTVGKNEELQAKMQKQRERRERREARRKNRLLQSTFRDKCQEICLKAYNQSIGLLPAPNPNQPECPCDVPAVKRMPEPIMDSCSCSESGSISSSDSDGDEWVVEFTPPVATWDPNKKPPPSVTSSSTQYTYLDYKVKLADRHGYPVPRYFTGPDGKKQCSDLGGFWGPGHVWLEINKDGYISCDDRWVPHTFIGTDGQEYSSEEGNYTDPNGNVYKIGVDGYIDEKGHWVFYCNKKKYGNERKGVSPISAATAPGRPARTQIPSPQLSDKKQADQPKQVLIKEKHIETKDKDKQKKTAPFKAKGISVMNVTVNNPWLTRMNYHRNLMHSGKTKRLETRKSVQSDMMLKDVDSKALRYQEILMPDAELRPPTKTSRACSTSMPVPKWNYASPYLANSGSQRR